jgi:hypothetical protein
MLAKPKNDDDRDKDIMDKMVEKELQKLRKQYPSNINLESSKKDKK